MYPDITITLFDLASKPGVPFSPYAWPVRLLLNYKSLPYRTAFTGFASLQMRLSAATRTTEPLYTVPAIIDPGPSGSTPTKLAESRRIAAYLEERYPDSGRGRVALSEEDTEMVKIFLPVLGLVILGTAAMLEEADRSYYVDMRRKGFGKEIEEICPAAGSACRDAIDAVRTGLTSLARTFHASPWPFGGATPTFRDFELIGWLMWLKAGTAAIAEEGVWDGVKDAGEGRNLELLDMAEKEGLMRVV
ncbi:Glutathione S-transferase-like protein ustS [Mycena kentingensis (nom. inval.)]|nr:Glutathione S-transferase-like protein ustS [Mycena kentingensis (nom. inval.)]